MGFRLYRGTAGSAAAELCGLRGIETHYRKVEAVALWVVG